MLEIITQFQQQAITPEYGRNLPRIQNPEVDDLRHALADMFGLPPLPLPLPAPAGPAIPMDAISESESRQSPAKSTVPSTRAHSPDPEVPDPEPKRTNTWALKDPAHPLHRWGTQQPYKGSLDQQSPEAEQNPQATTPSTHHSTPPGPA